MSSPPLFAFKLPGVGVNGPYWPDDSSYHNKAYGASITKIIFKYEYGVNTESRKPYSESMATDSEDLNHDCQIGS